MRFFVLPFELTILALLAYLIGIARGPTLSKFYNVTASVLMLVAVLELVIPWINR